MKHSFIYISIITLSILFSGCPKEIDPYIELKNVSSNIIESQGGEIEIGFFSAKSWVVTCNHVGCTISPSSGNGGETSINVCIDENTSTDKRIIEITLVSEFIQEVITINQNQKDSIAVDQESYTLTAQDTIFTFDVAANVDIEVSSTADWVKYKDKTLTRGMKTYTLNFGVEQNTTTTTREALLSIKGNGINQEVKIFQKGKDTIAVNQETYTLTAQDTIFTFDVATNIDIEVSASADWVKYKDKILTRSLQTYTLNFGLEKNLTTVPREAFVSITGNKMRQEVKVIQEGRVDSSQVYILHTNSLFPIPLADGDNVCGFIYWGDGKQDEIQKGLIHKYAKEQEYHLTMKLWGADEIEIPSIQGVLEIDLSEF